MRNLLLLFIAIPLLFASCSKDNDAKPAKPQLKSTTWTFDDQSGKIIFNADNTGKIVSSDDNSTITNFTYFVGDLTDGNVDFSITPTDDNPNNVNFTGYYNETILILKIGDETYSFTKVK